MAEEYRISTLDHELGFGRKSVWVIYNRSGEIVGGPTRTGGWANSFKTRADADHACAYLNGRRPRRSNRRRR